MSLRKFLLFLALGTIICWIAWITVVFSIDPTTSGWIGPFCFYISLFFALAGSLTLLGFFGRFLWKRRKEAAFRYVGISIRQAALLSMLFVGSLVLKGASMFVWWSAMLFVAGIALLEVFFLIRSQPHHLMKKHGREN